MLTITCNTYNTHNTPNTRDPAMSSSVPIENEGTPLLIRW